MDSPPSGHFQPPNDALQPPRGVLETSGGFTHRVARDEDGGTPEVDR